MNDPFEEQADEHEMKLSESDLTTAAKQNQDLSIESRKILKEFYDKILLYSAAAFSFNTTLISLALSNKPLLLSKIGLWFPNVYWMYSSMFFYLIAGASVLIIRRFDSYYTASFGMRNYVEKLLANKKTMKKMFQKYGSRFIITKGSTPKREIAQIDKDMPKMEKSLETNQVSQNFNYTIMRIFSYSSEIFALIATVTLLIFVIQITQGIVWVEDLKKY